MPWGAGSPAVFGALPKTMSLASEVRSNAGEGPALAVGLVDRGGRGFLEVLRAVYCSSPRPARTSPYNIVEDLEEGVPVG